MGLIDRLRTITGDRTRERGIQYEALGSQRYGAVVIGVAIAETMLGPADAMALSQNGLKYGLLWAIFPLGAALAQFVAGTFFVQRIYEQYAGRFSIGDIFSERCGKSARVVVGLVVVAQAIAFSGVLVLAGGQVLESFLGVNKLYGMLISAIVVGSYTAFGGISAVIRTNKLQAGFAWSVTVLALVGAIVLAMTSSGFDIQRVVVKEAFVQDHSFKVGVALFTAYFMGELLLPAYAMRALIAKDAPSARRGFVLAGLLTLSMVLGDNRSGVGRRSDPTRAQGSHR